MNGYTLWDKTPNTVSEKGKLFTKVFHFETNNEFKDRLVRVYLPSTYDFDNPNKRFKTIYMFDGKNLFDDYTSFVGEWKIDEIVESFIKEGKDGYIVIGIDAPNEDVARTLEMSPDSLKPKRKLAPKGYASLLANFVVNMVKPDIDETFYTLKEREYTGIGGSSMGGIMSFYMGLEYPQVFKYCLNFSPAFFLFTASSFKNYLDSHFSLDLPKQYFFVGGVGFEGVFVKTTTKTYKYFLERGFSKDNVLFINDPTKEHNEKSWSQYFKDAIEGLDK